MNYISTYIYIYVCVCLMGGWDSKAKKKLNHEPSVSQKLLFGPNFQLATEK